MRSRIILLKAVFYINLSCMSFGCKNEIDRSLREIAPPGGSGIKDYRYSTGELKTQNHWREFRVVATRYFAKDGRLLFESDQRTEPFWVLDVSDEGKIRSISQCTHNGNDGLSIVFKDGGLDELVIFDKGLEIRRHRADLDNKEVGTDQPTPPKSE